MGLVIMSKYSVYMHTSPSGKKYIGITGLKPKKRWEYGFGYRSNRYFYGAIKKYGWNNIKHEILYSKLTREEAIKREIMLIDEHKSNNRKYGYNIESGGKCNIVSDETKRRMSDAHKGIATFTGKKHTQEAKDKIRMYRLEREMSDDTKEKISKGNRGKKRNKSANSNVKILQLDIDGSVLDEFETITEAYEKLNKPLASHISQCCRGIRKTAYGYKWSYKEF